MNSQDSKTYNKARVFKLACMQGAISRLDLHRYTGLSKMTITNLVAEFLEQGMVRMVSTESTGVGRRTELVEVVADSLLTAGILLTHHGLYIAAVALDGSYQKVHEFPLDLEDTEQTLFDKIQAGVGRIMEERAGERFAAIVISTVGLVDVSSNALELSPFFPGIGRVTTLADKLSQRFSLPVYAENDANISALAELYFGEKPAYRNFIYVQMDEGIGAGLVLDGALFSAGNSFAGEIGHMTIFHDGVPCKCGNRGCLERYASTTAACAWYGAHRNRQPVSWQKLMELARGGDAIALETIQRTGGFLISGLVNLINIVDAECIYLGDKGADMLELIQPHMEQELNERRLQKKHVNIRPATFSSDARLRGVAALVIERYGG